MQMRLQPRRFARISIFQPGLIGFPGAQPPRIFQELRLFRQRPILIRYTPAHLQPDLAQSLVKQAYLVNSSRLSETRRQLDPPGWLLRLGRRMSYIVYQY
jgi:hypothetical protein